MQSLQSHQKGPVCVRRCHSSLRRLRPRELTASGPRSAHWATRIFTRGCSARQLKLGACPQGSRPMICPLIRCPRFALCRSARGFLSIRAANAQLAVRPNFKPIPPMDLICLICQAAGCAASPRDAFACCYAKLPANMARGRLSPRCIELAVPFCPLKNATWHAGKRMDIVLRPPEGKGDDFVTDGHIRTLTVQAMKMRPELR